MSRASPDFRYNRMDAQIVRTLPTCVADTVRMFESELERKEGMIADLHSFARDNHGLTPDECDMLVRSCRDRDDLRTALECIERIFS